MPFRWHDLRLTACVSLTAPVNCFGHIGICKKFQSISADPRIRLIGPILVIENRSTFPNYTLCIISLVT